MQRARIPAFLSARLLPVTIAAWIAIGPGMIARAADTAPRMAADSGEPAVWLLGEVHDNAAQHALRLEMLKALLAGGARPALLMEQFDRERQPDIDRVRASPSPPAADALIAAAGGSKQWNWAFYRPFVELALAYDLPLLAANVSRQDAQRVMAQGLAATGFDAQVPPDIVQAHAQAIEGSHCGMVGAATASQMAAAQVARDQFMARLVEASAGRGVVLLAGNGHVRKDTGVPRWLSPQTRRHTAAVGYLEAGGDAKDAFDRVVVTPPQPRDDPCAAMRPPAADAGRS